MIETLYAVGTALVLFGVIGLVWCAIHWEKYSG